MTKYLKPHLTLDNQINLLVSRGLIIEDRILAKHILSNISYYRLSNYFYHFWEHKSQHNFFPKTKFEDIINIYDFDSELRTICFQAIETIEISIRTKLSIFLSNKYGPYWFELENIMINKKSHADNIAAINDLLSYKAKEQFIQDHFKKYNSDKYPPSWKILEITSFGLLSRLYGNIDSSIKEKKAIARSLGLPNHKFLESWLKSISYVRNICAHHSRLWDRKLSTPLIPTKINKGWISHELFNLKRDGLYINLCCIKYLLDNIKQNNDFGFEIIKLFSKYDESIDLNKMFFPKNWKEDNFWK